jgi:hypothetical protein
VKATHDVTKRVLPCGLLYLHIAKVTPEMSAGNSHIEDAGYKKIGGVPS